MFIKRFFIFSLILSIFFGNIGVIYAQTSEDERAQLYAELDALQKEIAQKEAQLSEQRKQTGTIKKDVDLLTNQINLAKTKIKSKNLLIDKLSKDINSRTKTINILEDKLDISKDSLTQLLKKTNDLSQENLVYMLLSNDSISEFYQDLDSFASLKKSVRSSVDTIKTIKYDNEEQKKNLEKNKEDELDARNVIDNQKKVVEKTEKEKKTLLQISKNKEAEYQKVLAERQKRVTEIKNALFRFAGGNTKAIPFDEALRYAEKASEKTGVRTAFILAILTQESNLGKNVGTCNRATDPASKGWKVVMHPTRDQPAFVRITQKLGLNTDTTPVSCPIAGGGWGGAMGPAQFIPSTWESVSNEVSNLLGVSYANPWRAEDAIMASATYLKRRGAVGGVTAERNAACRYYSGRPCDNKKPANTFYGNSVISISNRIQDDIDYLKQYGVSRR